jgi:dTDP-4-amino-4,6-dideoxygalactose transaminase
VTFIRIAQPIIGPEEEAAVLRVLRSGRLAQGPVVAEFEAAVADYAGVEHAVAVSSGTAALIVALLAHEIGPGDEVIVPAFTFAATANAVLIVGAVPVLADIRADTYNIDESRLEALVTRRTRALIPVHLFGHPADMDGVLAVAARHGLIVIEDACQALGALWQGRQAGSFSTSCLSFYATKGITTGEGGMLLTNDAAVAGRARLLRNQGEVERYRTDLLGNNYRLTEVAAAIGLAQLRHAGGWIDARRGNAARLTELLSGVETPLQLPGAKHIYQQYTVRVPDGRRDSLQHALRAAEIESAVYYPLCLHQQPLYQQRGIGGGFPVAERAATEVLSLPVHAALTASDVERVAAAVNQSMARVESSRG